MAAEVAAAWETQAAVEIQVAEGQVESCRWESHREEVGVGTQSVGHRVRWRKEEGEVS